MALEAHVELDAVAMAENAGWFVRKVKWVGRRNAPDRVFIRGGCTFWVEFKKPGVKRARVTQELEHKRMKAAGALLHVVNSLDDFEWLLDKYTRSYRLYDIREAD